jgi:hypothetical protein
MKLRKQIAEKIDVRFKLPDVISASTVPECTERVHYSGGES